MDSAGELIYDYVEWAKEQVDDTGDGPFDEFLGITRLWRLVKAKDPEKYLENKILRAKSGIVQGMKRWDWKQLGEECDRNYEDAVKELGKKKADAQAEFGTSYRSTYLGSCLTMTPSGKYYLPFACSNVDIREALHDAVWYDALDMVAEKHGMYVTAGEGDSTDIWLVKGD